MFSAVAMILDDTKWTYFGIFTALPGVKYVVEVLFVLLSIPGLSVHFLFAVRVEE